MSQLRLIEGADAWWAIRGEVAARLPVEAVTSTTDPTGPNADRRRKRMLVPQAAEALRDSGFFTDPSPSYAVTVLTATNCNLGCAYCFQNTAPPAEGSFAPPRIPSQVLSSQTSQAIARFVQKRSTDAGAVATSLLIFGGEPLLNVPGCTSLLDAMAGTGLRSAEVVTNGVLLTEAIAANLVEHGLTRIQISFDGARRDHDLTRVTRNGRPTYDDILRNVAAAAQRHPTLAWNMRVNVSHRNVHELRDLIEDLSAAVVGSTDVTLHLALIDDTGLGYDNHVGYDRDLARRFIDLNDRAIAAGLTVPHSRPLSECPYCSTKGAWGAVVNADGTLYSCWENAGRDGWDIGTVERGYDAAKASQRWVACDFDIRPHGDPDQSMRFLDEVDSAALDTQYRRNMLRPLTHAT